MNDLKIAKQCIPKECKDDLVSRRQVYCLKLASESDFEFGQALINMPSAIEQNYDVISRKLAIEALGEEPVVWNDDDAFALGERNQWECDVEAIKGVPSAEPESLSDAYMKAVWTWLINYQIKVAELEGRYTPYEVLSWVANDWRKEHE